MDPVIFKIKKPVPGIDADTKGGTLDGDVFTTTDAAWIKHLRQLPEDQVGEGDISKPEPDEPEDPETETESVPA